jgi:hypothetical protein
MKKLLLKVAAMAALFIIAGCGKHEGAAEFEVKWDSDNSGTLEINNTSGKDIVLFHGQVPTTSSIMGGVRAQTTKKIDISKYVSDYDVGGYIVLRGFTREEYDANQFNLSEAKVEFNAFATYKAGELYRVTIDYNFFGDYAIRVTNRERIGIELRRDSPEGEKVAYLPALRVNQMLYTQTSDAIALYPFYVLYNKSTQTITTIKATDIMESVTAVPRAASNPSGLNTVYFPNDATLSWEKIVGSLKSPVAYITVSNNIMNQAAYFTNAASKRYISQNGYDAVGSGEQLVFEVEAGDPDEDGNGGIEKSLMAVVYQGRFTVPVLFEGETTLPKIKNGYEYIVSISGSGSVESGYSATIREVRKRDLSDQLESL